MPRPWPARSRRPGRDAPSAAAERAAARLAEAEQALAGAPGRSPAPWMPSAIAGRPGPKRSPRPWTRPGPGPVPAAWPGSRACSGRWSSWSTWTPATRRLSRPPRARRFRPCSCRTSRPPAGAWPTWPSTTPPAPSSRWPRARRPGGGPAGGPAIGTGGLREGPGPGEGPPAGCRRALGRATSVPAPGAVSELLDRLLARAVVVDRRLVQRRRPGRGPPRAGRRDPGRRPLCQGIWRTGAHGTGATGRRPGRGPCGRRAGHRRGRRGRRGPSGRPRLPWSRPRSAASEARRSAAENAAQLQAAGEALRRARADLAEAEDELAAMGPQDQELVGPPGRRRARVAELEALLPELEAAAAEESRRAPGSGPSANAWPSEPAPSPRCAVTWRCGPPVSRNAGPC